MSDDTLNDSQYLLWIDLETTGLDVVHDTVLQISGRFTDILGNDLPHRPDLNVVFDWKAVIPADDLEELIRSLQRDNPYVYDLHEGTGLWDSLREMSQYADDFPTLSFSDSHPLTKMFGGIFDPIERLTGMVSSLDLPRKAIQIAGSSVKFDFYALENLSGSSKLFDSIHYRTTDVTTIRQFLYRTGKVTREGLSEYKSLLDASREIPNIKHNAVYDIISSIEEYRYLIGNA